MATGTAARLLATQATMDTSIAARLITVQAITATGTAARLTGVTTIPEQAQLAQATLITIPSTTSTPMDTGSAASAGGLTSISPATTDPLTAQSISSSITWPV